MLITFFDLETHVRSRRDELQQRAIRAQLRSGALPVNRSTNPTRPIATFIAAIQRALAGWLSPNRASVACATCA
jgi:hypothetical protein